MKTPALADEQLVARYNLTSDEECFEALYQRYVRRVYRKCLTMTKDTELAEDFTQDIFLKVFSTMGSFQGRSKFSTWLYSISHHYCLDQIRRGKRLASEPWSEALLEQFPTESDENSLGLRLSQLDELLADLPADDVALLQLRYYQNQSIKELAQRYQLKESAVKMRLKRIRDKLYEQHQLMLDQS